MLTLTMSTAIEVSKFRTLPSVSTSIDILMLRAGAAENCRAEKSEATREASRGRTGCSDRTGTSSQEEQAEAGASEEQEDRESRYKASEWKETCREKETEAI